jgi:hypothetical protein
MAASDLEQSAFVWGPNTAAPGARGLAVPVPVGSGPREAAPASGARGRVRREAAAAVVARRQVGAEERLPPDDELWDVRAAARYLRRSVSWVYHRAEDGTLPVKRLGGWGLRFVPAELRTWVATGEAAKRR